MEEYCLEDLFELQMGKTPSRDNINYWNSGNNDWISIGDLSGFNKYVGQTKERLTELAITESGIKEIPPNTVIMSFKLSIGKVAITTEKTYSNEAIMAFIDKKVKSISSDYLYYLLLSKDWSEGTNKAVMGMTLNKATLSKVKIKLHDINEQEQIVSILDKSCKLISLKKQQLIELDALIKSRFVEMFGDPVTNTMSWQLECLSDIGELGRGVSKHRPRNAPELLGGEYPLIQTGDVANAELYLTEFKSTYSELGLSQSKMWNKGTLCITIAANIAKTSILNFNACFPDSVVGFVPNEKTNVIFIHFWFGFFQKLLESQAPESAQKNINLKTLSELKIIIPPIDLQNQFATFVQHIDKLKAEVLKSLNETQLLFDALMQKYFG